MAGVFRYNCCAPRDQGVRRKPTANKNAGKRITNLSGDCFQVVSLEALARVQITFFHIGFLCHIQTGITVNKNWFIMINPRDLTGV